MFLKQFSLYVLYGEVQRHLSSKPSPGPILNGRKSKKMKKRDRIEENDSKVQDEKT